MWRNAIKTDQDGVSEHIYMYLYNAYKKDIWSEDENGECVQVSVSWQLLIHSL